MPYWSVVQTESRREQVAADFLGREFKVYLPKILTVHKRVAPLFPGYLFVEIEERWWSVRWSIGVMKILMANDQPARVAPALLDKIRAYEIDGLVRLPDRSPKVRLLRCGDKIKVVRGSFAGRLGVYQGQSGAMRSRILLNLLGREVKTIVPAADVARCG